MATGEDKILHVSILAKHLTVYVISRETENEEAKGGESAPVDDAMLLVLRSSNLRNYHWLTSIAHYNFKRAHFFFST